MKGEIYMENNKKQYNLLTAISMIVGIVIGSGIFFKSDDILRFTGGSVGLGILLFIIAGLSIVFGSLSVAQLVLRSNKVGGVISYMEVSFNKAFGGAFGWFHALCYYPTLTAVVSWVAGIYITMLFGLPQTLELQCAIGFTATAILFLVNIFSKKIGGYLQVSSTVIKLIPLLLIAILGLVKGNPTNITMTSVLGNTSGLGFIAAIVPIAFSFDGWIISTSISHELKNPQKTLPLALIISPLFIVIAYSLYLVGISALIGPEKVVAMGDAHVDEVANLLMGPSGAKIMLTFVIVSILGTVNGIVLGGMRLPYLLANKGVSPLKNLLGKNNEKYDIPIYSSIFFFIITVVWYIGHYFVMKYSLLQGSDVSEIAIVMNYVCYIVIYFAVIRMYKNKEITNAFYGLVSPIIATIGSVIIFLGSALIITAESVQLNYKSVSFMMVSVVILLVGYYYSQRNINKLGR